ncbi:MAG: ankyrin repeat domain-containing protein [Bacteroidetes bacterium]|nr:ankyrin repeat domain-containing protein [Bacteroidota bacterium]
MNIIKYTILIYAFLLISYNCTSKNYKYMNNQPLYSSLKPNDEDIINFINEIDILKQNNEKRAIVISSELQNSSYKEYQNKILDEDEQKVLDMLIALKETDLEAYNQLKQNKEYCEDHFLIQHFIYKKTEEQEELNKTMILKSNHLNNEYSKLIKEQKLLFNKINNLIIYKGDFNMFENEKKIDNKSVLKLNNNLTNNSDIINNGEKSFVNKIKDCKSLNNDNFSNTKLTFQNYSKLIKKNDIENFNKMVHEDKNFNINMIDDNNETLILKACKYGNIDFIINLQNLEADLTNINIKKENCVLLASKYLNIEILRYLNKFSSFNCQNYNCDTPLHLAANQPYCKNKNLETIKFLLNNSLNIDSTNENNETPIFLSYQNKKAFKYLLKQNANPHIETNYDWLPLYNACLKGYDSIVSDIITDMIYNLKIKLESNEYRIILIQKFKEKLNNALICCCLVANKKITKYLVAKGANINCISIIFKISGYHENLQRILKKICPQIIYSFDNHQINYISPIKASIINGDKDFISFIKENRTFIKR